MDGAETGMGVGIGVGPPPSCVQCAQTAQWTVERTTEDPSCSADTSGQITMSSGGAPEIDPDADFVYDYYTLRVGGLTFAGVIVFLSILLLAGNSIRRCGKSKPRVTEEKECKGEH
ncbi:hypothetical protein SKAU_G00298650 [Synaphobranchus kaupii]|uniref:FXYD domain-containing ion transport regulator n=1 Tax=Synaphobranchus kaupii TaxID=118154 RepID=A0A9Q1IM31_SYNKA|nr:hypothetical protein SKAU_G00298650 [Synaphobranchus kaupii]